VPGSLRRESLPGSTAGAFYLRRARTRASETTRRLTRGCARFSAARDDPRARVKAPETRRARLDRPFSKKRPRLGDGIVR